MVPVRTLLRYVDGCTLISPGFGHTKEGILMSSWRFPRFSSRRRPHRTEASGNINDNALTSPPRYSNLSLSSSEAAPVPSPEVSSARVEYAEEEYGPSRSFSRMSQLSSPTYVTHDDPDNRSISSSTITLTSPPRYSGLSNAPNSEATNQEYSYTIRSGSKSEPWATLRLYDAGPHAAKRTRHPRFTNKDDIFGNVELSLASPQVIKNIELILQGKIVTSALGDGGSITFLEHPYTLWDSKFGDPRLLGDGDSQPASAKYDGKLVGNWVFPFVIPFPTHLDLSTLRGVYNRDGKGPLRFLPEVVTPAHGQNEPFKRRRDSSHITPFDARYTPNHPRPSSPQFVPISSTTPASGSPTLDPYPIRRPSGSSSPLRFNDHPAKSGRPELLHSNPMVSRHRGSASMQPEGLPTSFAGHALPQSFLEHDVMASVHYELILTITHGRFSTKSRVNATVIHAPISTPPPMSLGRQIAYQRRNIPPGPHVDPDGWRQLYPVSIKGTFLDQKELTVSYTLFLAMPLSYARGTVIPCCLTIACDDVVALNLFANPRTPRVRLRRLNRFLQNQAERPSDHEYAPLYGSPTVSGVAPSFSKLFDTPAQLTKRKSLNRARSSQHSRGGSGSTTIEPFLPTSRQGEDMEDSLGSSDEETELCVGDGAVWCTPPTYTQEPQSRMLYGELHLPTGLQPTCKFPLFNILYRVELLAPATNAFVPDLFRKANKGKARAKKVSETAGEVEHVYASQFVEITTDVRQDESFPLAFVKGAD